MAKKEDAQTMNVTAVTPETEGRETVFDAAYWSSFNEDNVAPVSAEQQKEVSNHQEQLEKMYPVFERKQIPLGEIIPSKAEWNFFPNQDNTILEDLMKNIVVYGQLSPAIVWEQPEGKYMLLGGHTRYKALENLYQIFSAAGDTKQAARFGTMDCNVYAYNEIDELEARKLIIYDNVIRRDNTTAIKARAVINMTMLEKESRAKRSVNIVRERALANVAKILGEPEGTVKDLYRLRTLIPDFWPLVDAKGQDKITNQFARAISLLPATLQQYIYDNALYLKKLSVKKLATLKAAKDTGDIDAVYNAPEEYIISSRIAINEPPPKDYKTLTLVMDPKYEQVIKDIVLQGISHSTDIPVEAKLLAQKALDCQVF